MSRYTPILRYWQWEDYNVLSFGIVHSKILILLHANEKTMLHIFIKQLSLNTHSLVPRLSLSLPLDFTHVNIMREGLKERESLVRNCAHPCGLSQLNSSQTTPGKATGGRGSVLLSFNFSRIIFTWVKSKGMERDSLGTRLQYACTVYRCSGILDIFVTSLKPMNSTN